MLKARSAFVAVLVCCACAAYAIPASATTTIEALPDHDGRFLQLPMGLRRCDGAWRRRTRGDGRRALRNRHRARQLQLLRDAVEGGRAVRRRAAGPSPTRRTWVSGTARPSPRRFGRAIADRDHEPGARAVGDHGPDRRSPARARSGSTRCSSARLRPKSSTRVKTGVVRVNSSGNAYADGASLIRYPADTDWRRSGSFQRMSRSRRRSQRRSSRPSTSSMASTRR